MAATIDQVRQLRAKVINPQLVSPLKALDDRSQEFANRNLWFNPKERDRLIEFYSKYRDLSDQDRQTLAQEEQRYQLRSSSEEFCNELRELFQNFLNNPSNLKKLTRGEGANERLVEFLATPDIYEITAPKQLLTKALEKEDIDPEDVKAMAFFIITYFSSNKIDDERSANEILKSVMKELGGQNSDEALDPDSPENGERQTKLATLIVGTVIANTNPQTLDEKNLITIAAAARYNPKDHIEHSKLVTLLKELVNSIAKLWGGKPVYWVISDELNDKIRRKRNRRDAKIEHQKWLKARPEQFHLSREQAKNQPQLKLEAQAIDHHEVIRLNEILDKTGKGYLIRHRKGKDPVKTLNEATSIHDRLIEKALQVAQERGVDISNLSAIVKKETEIKRLWSTPTTTKTRWGTKPEFQPPYDGRMGYEKKPTSMNPESIPKAISHFDRMPTQEELDQFAPATIALVLAERKLVVYKNKPGLKAQLQKELEQRHYPAGPDNPQSFKTYGPKTDQDVDIDRLGNEVDAVVRIMYEIADCCERTGIDVTHINEIEQGVGVSFANQQVFNEALSNHVEKTTGVTVAELKQIERQIGISVNDLRRIAEVSGMSFTQIKEHIKHDPRIGTEIQTEEAGFLMAIIQLAKKINQQQGPEINLNFIESLHSVSRKTFTLTDLINTSAITGLTLEELATIKKTLNVNFSKTKARCLEKAGNDSDLGQRYFQLTLIKCAIRVGIKLSPEALNVIDEYNLLELDDSNGNDPRNPSVRAYLETMPKPTPLEDPSIGETASHHVQQDQPTDETPQFAAQPLDLASYKTPVDQQLNQVIEPPMTSTPNRNPKNKTPSPNLSPIALGFSSESSGDEKRININLNNKTSFVSPFGSEFEISEGEESLVSEFSSSSSETESVVSNFSEDERPNSPDSFVSGFSQDSLGVSGFGSQPNSPRLFSTPKQQKTQSVVSPFVNPAAGDQSVVSPFGTPIRGNQSVVSPFGSPFVGGNASQVSAFSTPENVQKPAELSHVSSFDDLMFSETGEQGGDDSTQVSNFSSSEKGQEHARLSRVSSFDDSMFSKTQGQQGGNNSDAVVSDFDDSFGY